MHCAATQQYAVRWSFSCDGSAKIQWSPLNSHGKCAEKSCELSEHVNYQSLFYVTFLSMAESCVQSKHAN